MLLGSETRRPTLSGWMSAAVGDADLKTNDDSVLDIDWSRSAAKFTALRRVPPAALA
jgi:hypothetical protein